MKQAVSLEDWKEGLRKRLLVEKVIHGDLLPHVSVAPEEIKNYYESNWRESAHVETLRARHILLNNEDEANQILERLKKGEDFVTLARRHSVGPEAERGGDLGYVVRGQLPESLETPLFEVQPGALSPVVKTLFGFHIFQVIEERERGKANIEDCMDEIRERLMEEKLEVAYGPWLDALRKRYHVEINKEVI
jgi:parvulin-like peptidyl-prolyl isomerase